VWSGKSPYILNPFGSVEIFNTAMRIRDSRSIGVVVCYVAADEQAEVGLLSFAGFALPTAWAVLRSPPRRFKKHEFT
jgi:hypothetical protein